MGWVQSLRLELAPRTAVAELIPGEVDTAMGADLHRPDQDSFPMAEFFRGDRSKLTPSTLAVRICHWVLPQTPEPQFTSATPFISKTRNSSVNGCHREPNSRTRRPERAAACCSGGKRHEPMCRLQVACRPIGNCCATSGQRHDHSFGGR